MKSWDFTVPPMPRKVALLLTFFAATVVAGRVRADEEEKVDFRRQILPIFEGACVDCHGVKKASGGLRLTTGSKLMAGGISGPVLVPKKPEESYLLKRLRGEGDEDRMPLKGEALSKEEIKVIERWIKEGAVIPPEEPSEFVPAPGGLKRLTVAQYRNSIHDLLGERVPVPPLEPDTLLSGSAAVGAGRIVISRQATEKFALAAFQLARAALADEDWRAKWIACDSAAPYDAACAGHFVERFGRRAWRRPLTGDEKARYLAVIRSAARPHLGDGVTAAVAALLQSPHFLYRVEVGVPDPQDPKRHVLSDFEMASRLSYFLWGAPPDDQLLDAAAAGRLSTDEGLRAEAERMLVSPKARNTVTAFFTELLRLNKLDHLNQFKEKYKQVSSTLGQSMREETMRVVEEIALDPQRDFREMFDAPFTYLNGELARLYGLPVPADEEHFTRVSLPTGLHRRGVLGHASFLAINAHATAPSPTKRGRYIREALLCQAVPPPPPDVSTKLPKDGEGPLRTTRQKLVAHRKLSQCNGCHKAMDPMGLAFETFDGIGAYRSKEDNGLVIDPSGELDGVAFSDPAALAVMLRNSPKVGVCVARHLYRFALGHLESEGEEPLVADLAAGLERDGYRFLSLVLNVVKSRGFRYLSAP
jgi:mono/diheme cytochrome c family protein